MDIVLAISESTTDPVVFFNNINRLNQFQIQESLLSSLFQAMRKTPKNADKFLMAMESALAKIDSAEHILQGREVKPAREVFLQIICRLLKRESISENLIQFINKTTSDELSKLVSRVSAPGYFPDSATILAFDFSSANDKIEEFLDGPVQQKSEINLLGLNQAKEKKKIDKIFNPFLNASRTRERTDEVRYKLPEALREKLLKNLESLHIRGRRTARLSHQELQKAICDVSNKLRERNRRKRYLIVALLCWHFSEVPTSGQAEKRKFLLIMTK